MPACDARYDVLYSGATGAAVGHTGRNRAVVDMLEDRLPDAWGDPGPLLAAHLRRYKAPGVRSIKYAPARGRMALWVDGCPRRVIADRRFLRWALPPDDPPPHDDPDWVIPP